MRDLKFRTWDIKNKRFVNIVRLIFDQFGELDYAEVVFKGKMYKLYPSEIVLEQDTGFKDKNGKSICEGDIVRYFDAEDHLSEAAIRFGNPPIPYTCDDGTMYLKGFYLDWIRTYNDEDFTFDEWSELDNDVGCDYKIIGNIHENKELLC